MGEDTDDYGVNEEFQEDIKHNRTKVYEFIDKTWRIRLQVIRENNFNKKIKKSNWYIYLYRCLLL